MSIIWYTCNLIIINHYNPSLTVTQHLFVRPFGLFLTLFAQLKGRLATKHQCIKACMTERLSGWMNEFSLESVHCLLSITGVIFFPPEQILKDSYLKNHFVFWWISKGHTRTQYCKDFTHNFLDFNAWHINPLLADNQIALIFKSSQGI